ncbi:hypothetical protein [Streptosporangium sp. NPDC051022]|uniref:hypothetical protein n=1 Tax=Streptosporangium sp. NPDC051022 TaxID=3155752 RepID=UPI003445FD79
MRSRDNEQPSPADQLVHPPAPVVRFATDAAAQSVIGPIRDRYEQAAAFAYAEWQQADKAETDIAAYQRDIADAEKRIAEDQQLVSDREQQIQRRTLDRQQHLTHAQQGADVANPNAQYLNWSGVQVPEVIRPLPLPLVDTTTAAANGLGLELSGDPDGNLARFNEAHDSLAPERGDVL